MHGVTMKITNKLLLFMAPSNFHLFLHLKKRLAGKKFDDYDEVQEEVMTWFKGQAADSGTQKLVPRLNECLDNAGDCVESYVQAIHSQCSFCKLKMFHMFETFVSLLLDMPCNMA
jgi:hypothetical protein